MKHSVRMSLVFSSFLFITSGVLAADLEVEVENGGQNEVAIVPLTAQIGVQEYEFAGFQIGRGAKLKIWNQGKGVLEIQPTFRHLKYRSSVNDKGTPIQVPETIVEWEGPLQRITPQRTYILQQTGPASIRVRWSE